MRSWTLGTPTAARVQNAVHSVLVANDMSSNDDIVMAEYVTVMIANQKGPDAIADELRELVGGELDARIPHAIWAAADAAADKSAPSGSPRIARNAPARSLRRSPSPRTRHRSASPDAMQEDRQDTRHSHRDPYIGRHDVEAGGDRSGAGRQPPRSYDTRPAARMPRRDMERFPAQKGRAKHNDSSSLSIFGRAGIPDPTAAPFVPENPPPEFVAMMSAMAQAPPLLARLDPMMPNNPAFDAAGQAADAAHAALRDPSTFPTVPTHTALCRYGLHCTNPQCGYSHPSPANAGKDGNENALVLSEDACDAGGECKDKECIKSHVSPAVAFVAHRAPPCRYQAACTNPACTFTHLDAQGRVVPPPAATPVACRFGAQCTRADCRYTHPPRSKTPCRYGDACTRRDCLFVHPRDGPANPTADRLKPFAATNDTDRELVLPGGSTEGAVSVL